MAKRRRTQAERRAATREALLDAAAAVIAERGFHAATVEDVASRAGVTTGALYGHFAGKEDLFLAVFEVQVAAELGRYREIYSGEEGVADMGQAGAARFMRRLREDSTYFPLFIEFWSYGVRNPRVQADFAARFAAFRGAFADVVQGGAAAAGLSVDRQAAEQLGTIVNALGNGLALERTVDPDAVPDELLGFAYRILFQALAQAAADGEFSEFVAKASAAQ